MNELSSQFVQKEQTLNHFDAFESPAHNELMATILAKASRSNRAFPLTALILELADAIRGGPVRGQSDDGFESYP